MVNADKSAWIEIPYGMSFTSWYVDDTGYLHLQLNGEDIEGFTPFFVGFSGSGGGGGGGGGGGSSASYSVTLKNSLDTRSLTVPSGVAANLKFKYTSLDSDESDDGSGIGTVTVNGATVASISIPQGENTLDVSSYLTVGTNTVKIKVENSEGTSRTLSYTVIVVELSITSNFDDSLIYSDAITFKYTPYGSVDKTVNFFVDGEAAGTESVSSSGRQLTKIFPAMPHGAHTIKVYATAVMDGNTITSNILTYDIVCIQNGQTSVIIASSYTKETATQGELVTIPFMVYDPSSQTSTVTLTIKSGSETYSTQTSWHQEEATEFETVVDKLFIPSFSECEVPNRSSFNNIKVEEYKDIYAKEGSKYTTFDYSGTRSKWRPDRLDRYSDWWTRTVCPASDYVLKYNGESAYMSAGYIYGDYANREIGILLMFCI